MGKLFLSHRLELLAGHLAMEMAQDGYPPLTPRIILVPTASMKQWLLLQCADLNDERGIAGCKIFTLREGLGVLLPASSGFTEVFCAIFTALSDCTDATLNEYLKESSRRPIELSYQLALLFQRYGEQGQMSLFQSDPDHWQIKLFHRLFIEGKLRLPIQVIPKESMELGSPIHCFGFDFMAQSVWQFLALLPSVSAYLFSPCSHYWEDVYTDRERSRLGRYWKQKGAPTEKREELDRYLREAPPLLANWGKLGRETLKILEPFDWEMVEDYRQLEGERNSNLERLQQRLLNFTAKEERTWPQDSSISLSLTGSSRFKEIEHLRRSILRLMEKENLLCSEIAVLASDIQEYAPLIECIFSDLPYRISGVENRSKSLFYQGMHRLFDLISDEWEAEDLLSLFENPSFCRAQKWDAETLDRFRVWLSHQKREEAYEERMLDQLVYLFPDANSQAPIGSFEQIEQWIRSLRSLRMDLASLKLPRTLSDWVLLLQRLVEKYLFIDLSDEADAAAWSFFQQSVKEMIRANDPTQLFPFAVIRKLLQRPGSGGQINASHLHAIRFASLEEGAFTPVRALFLIGMDEESYPRRCHASSIDLLAARAKFYIPNPADRDRYLFLQALFTAREFLQISYRHLTPDEGKSVNPSFLVEELRRSLDLPIPEEKAMATAATVPFSFPWPEKPTGSLPEGEIVIPLSELVSLSRHPWKFYLQKKWGIYLEDRSEESFSLQRAKGLRASLQKPIEEVLKEELAPGICGEALKIELLKAAGVWGDRKESWDAAMEPLSFRLQRQTKKQTKQGWEFPPIELTLGDRLRVKITGDVKTLSSKGFLHAGDDSVEGLLKVWPECLAAAVALDRKEIHFLKSGKIRSVEKPEESLKAFLTYYFLSLSAPSPLLSEWAPVILRKGPEEWEKQIRDRIAGKGVRFEDPVFDWVVARVTLPTAEQWWQHWGEALSDRFASLLALYPTRGSHASV